MNYMRISLLMLGMLVSMFTLCAAAALGSGNTINADMAKSKARPTVSAENVNYHEDTGLYALAGNVRIKLAERTFLTQTARINPVSLLLWTDGG